VADHRVGSIKQNWYSLPPTQSTSYDNRLSAPCPYREYRHGRIDAGQPLNHRSTADSGCTGLITQHLGLQTQDQSNRPLISPSPQEGLRNPFDVHCKGLPGQLLDFLESATSNNALEGVHIALDEVLRIVIVGKSSWLCAETKVKGARPLAKRGAEGRVQDFMLLFVESPGRGFCVRCSEIAMMLISEHVVDSSRNLHVVPPPTDLKLLRGEIFAHIGSTWPRFQSHRAVRIVQIASCVHLLGCRLWNGSLLTSADRLLMPSDLETRHWYDDEQHRPLWHLEPPLARRNYKTLQVSQIRGVHSRLCS
jgi:hypothetical protein